MKQQHKSLQIMKTTLNILAISGSIKTTSVNTLTINALTKLLPVNVNVKLYRCLDKLPYFNPETTQESSEVASFRNDIARADAVIISTPEYAFGVPGVLKNALDLLVASGELNAKPVAAISVSTLVTGGASALASLRLTLGALGSAVIDETCLSIGSVKNKIDNNGEITDNKTLLALESLATALLESMGQKEAV